MNNKTTINKSLTMKKLAFFLVMLAAVAVGQAQTTGSGIVLLTGSTYVFTPTTVDSITTFEFQLVNTVGVEQIVYFGGLDAPFNVTPLIPTAVPASDTLDMELTFNPSEIGMFSDTLEVLGNVFGNADLVISGQGIQVILEWTPEIVAFDTTAIGQSSSASIDISSVGNGAGTISEVSFSNDIFSLDEANSVLTIEEDSTETLTFIFEPTGAGVFNETVQLHTNDPNNNVIEIELQGFSISEVGGEVCDAIWSLDDSPFTLVGDLFVPESCSLTIEPGVTVVLDGYEMVIDGEITCQGTFTQPITAIGGVITINQGAPTLISYLNHESSDTTVTTTSGYELVYYNNFEQGGSDYDFDCYDTWDQEHVTGNTTSNDYGCENFYRQSSSSWSDQENSGDHYLRWYSYGFDAYLYLDQAYYAPSSGTYEISFNYESDRYERWCNIRIDIWENNEWITYYESPYDIEGNSEHRRVARASKFYQEGEEIKWRMYHNVGSYNSSPWDQLYSYIDEVRVERKRAESNVVLWTMSDNASDFASVQSNYGSYAGDQEVELVDEELRIRMRNQTIDFNTNGWSLAPMIVPESGWYYFDFDTRVEDPSYHVYHHLYYKSSQDNSWKYLWDNRQQYSSDYACYEYDDRTETIKSVQFLNAGSRIDFLFYSYYWTSGSRIDWDLSNFRMYQLIDVSAPEPTAVVLNYPGNIQSYREIAGVNVNGSSISSFEDLSLNGCSLDQVFVQGNADEVLISNGEIGLFNSSSDTIAYTIEDSSVGVIETTGSEETSTISSSIIGSLTSSGNLTIDVVNSEFDNGGIELTGSGALNVQNANIHSGTNGIHLDGDWSADISHALIHNNQNRGLWAEISGTVSLLNSVVANNANEGLVSNGDASLDFVTVADNGGIGWATGDDGVKFIKNCIFSNNDLPSGNNVNWSGDGVLTDNNYNYTGITANFADSLYHLNEWSEAVDGGMPWLQDANMPYGLGGPQADLGAYGGPDNAGWGGQLAPTGEPTAVQVDDIPQDQGYSLGVSFGASAFDNPAIENGVTHYSIWRHFDPTGEPLNSLSDGNWELVSEMQSQGFDGYAIQSEALGNTNAFEEFTTCYTVIAHTSESNVSWTSAVGCGEAIDNLAPEEPELNGLVLESGEVQISWQEPAEEDYAYTEIFSDGGFSTEVGNDTLAIDNAALAGVTYTYTAIHYDFNGNASEPSSLTLDVEGGFDAIDLNPGWNLISIDRTLSESSVEQVFSSLTPGNLQYVTGFQEGVQFYDPNGLSFLNTLSNLDDGYGYWVKVEEQDVLHVQGAQLPVNYRPELTAGWNLIGYPNQQASNPAEYFADLIELDNLVYVTGFDQGSQVFDPNGLPFLNTLIELENGYGYWLKTVVGDDPNGLILDDSNGNPSYMIMNGKTASHLAGTTIDVVTTDGLVVGQIAVIEDGYLMTTAVYGKDETLQFGDGLEEGEEMNFMLNGRLANESITWSGGMEHKVINLSFSDEFSACTLSPNPAQNTVQLAFNLVVESEVTISIHDASGRLVQEQFYGAYAAGHNEVQVSLDGLAPGAYEVSASDSRNRLHSAMLLLQ